MDRPVERPHVGSRLDRSSHSRELPLQASPDDRRPARLRDHGGERQRDDLAPRLLDSPAPQLRHENGPGLAALQDELVSKRDLELIEKREAGFLRFGQSPRDRHDDRDRLPHRRSSRIQIVISPSPIVAGKVSILR